MPPHRKRIKHYDDPHHVRELTFSCYRRLPLLDDDSRRRLLAQLVYPLPSASPISLLLTGIKRPFSFRMKRIFAAAASPLIKELTVRQRPGVTTFRFWQEGPGYDRNLTEPDTVQAAIDYIHMNPVRRGLVQRAEDWPWSSARHYLRPQPTDASSWPTVHGLPPDWLGVA